MLQGLGFCVWLTVRKSNPWWSASKTLCDETESDFCRPHVRLLHRASTPREAANTTPLLGGIFRVSKWTTPRAEILHAEGWPPLYRIVFDGHLDENHMELEVARRFDIPFHTEDLNAATEIFQNESLFMTDAMRLIIRAEAPSVRRWKDISP